MSDFSLLMLYWLKQVWTPDIVLYNSAGDGEQGREMRTLIQVRTHVFAHCRCTDSSSTPFF
jgi:hypothetical protein